MRRCERRGMTLMDYDATGFEADRLPLGASPCRAKPASQVRWGMQDQVLPCANGMPASPALAAWTGLTMC